jgi:HPt (histidine-containing phosphotransfer) domain-containing protein
MQCCKDTWQVFVKKSAWVDEKDGVNRLISGCAFIEKFVNLSDLMARVEDDRELLAELFTMFQEELPGLQGALHNAMRTGDLPAAAEAAHALKGMLANLSMKQGTSLAASIEAAARGGDKPAFEETLATFDGEIVALSTAVDAFMAGKQDCEF